MIQKVNSAMEFTPLIYRLYELTHAGALTSDHMPHDYARSRPTYASLFYKYYFKIKDK